MRGAQGEFGRRAAVHKADGRAGLSVQRDQCMYRCAHDLWKNKLAFRMQAILLETQYNSKSLRMSGS